MLEILTALLVLAALVVLPLVLLVALLRVLFELVMLPLRLLGVGVHLALAGAGFFIKVLVGGIGLVVGLVILPLLPLLLVVLLVWAVVRLAQPPRVLVRSPQPR